MQPRSTTVSWRQLYVILLPIIIFLVLDRSFELLGNYKLDVPISTNAINSAREASGRYLFFATYIGFLFVAIIVVTVSVRDMLHYLDRNSQKRVSFAALFLSLAVLFAVLLRYGGASPHTYEFIGKSSFETALSHSALPGLPGWSMLDVFSFMLKIANLTIMVALPIVIVGGTSTLGTTIPDARTNIAVLLSYQVMRLKSYLYMSAALLVGGTALIISWMQWPSFIVADADKKTFDDLVRSISTLFGVQYTMILCSYYIPISMMLTRRARVEAERSLEESGLPHTAKEITEWMKKSGLGVYDLRSYKTIAALVAPLLTGLIGGIVGGFSGK